MKKSLQPWAMPWKTPLAAAALSAALACGAAGMAQAETLRWAAANDILTFDPHAQNHLMTNTFVQLVYEGLTRYDKEFRIEPALASSWTFINPTRVQFKLREGVRFHNGATMTADDVVFSLQRAMTPPSNMGAYVRSIAKVEKIDDMTVQLDLKGPSPLLLRELIGARIMNKAWAEEHNSVLSQDFAAKKENHAARHANGTGPFVLQSWQPDTRTRLTRNEQWWDRPEGNVTEVVFTPIASAATRTAALLSNQVDFINDPPPQDLQRLAANADIRILEGAEYRTIFFGLDLHRDELLYGSVKDRNPLKDRRVRQALYQAIDIDAIHKRIMRGLSVPTGAMVAPMVHGWSQQLEQRASAYDPEAARKLLAEAGYPEGFSLELDCPNDRYINDEAICQAVTAMWARVGIKTQLRTMPMATYSKKVASHDASVYLYGWGVATFDALYTLDSLAHTREGGSAGNFNMGRLSDAKLDAAIAAARTETDEAKRDAQLSQALQIVKDEYYYLPLHHQIRPWAMRKNVQTIYRANDVPMPQWTTVQPASGKAR